MGLKYRVTVDGTAYTVEVDELGAGAPFAAAPAPVANVPAPVAAPVAAAPAPAAAQPAAAPVAAAPTAAGSVVIEAPLPGKILDIKVSVGAPVKTGDLVLMLEAMKMEHEIYAPYDGVIERILVAKGQSVTEGEVLLRMSR